MIILLTFATLIFALLGGFVALRYRKSMHHLLGFTAGVLLGVVAFGLLPEIFEQLNKQNQDPTGAMIALVAGFLIFHVFEKSVLIHHSHEDDYQDHKHPSVGVASALALFGHSFIDGIGIGIAFQAGQQIGLAVAVAIIAHRFTDGLNTVNLMLVNKNKPRKAIFFLIAVALAPVFGALSTMLFTISGSALILYLGFFAGFILYIGASEILPEAHSKHSSYKTIATTLLGVALMFGISQLG